jgi:hypothetical protein
MTFSDFVTLTNQNPRAVLLLEGTREPLPSHAPRLTELAVRLGSALPAARFRSGNAPGSDALFLQGLDAVLSRVELVTAHEGHRSSATLARTCALGEAAPETLKELVRLSTAATPSYRNLFERYFTDNLPPALKAKARYLLRDTLKVHGCPKAGLAPASGALLYLNPSDPDLGGTGHTRRVCSLLAVQVWAQDQWLKW